MKIRMQSVTNRLFRTLYSNCPSNQPYKLKVSLSLLCKRYSGHW